MSDTFKLHQSIGYRLTYVARINERGFEARLGETQLTRLGWCTLCAVAYEGMTQPSDIAHFIGVDRTAVSRSLRQLEAQGCVIRKTAKHDGRSRRIMLTPHGETLLEQATAQARDNMKDFEARLSPTEQRVLFDLLGRLIDEERSGTEPLKGL